MDGTPLSFIFLPDPKEDHDEDKLPLFRLYIPQ